MQIDHISAVPRGEEAERRRLRGQAKAERQRRAAAQRRAWLLDEALSLYAERGPEGFHMRDLAARTGYTAGALYVYFASRDAILLALRERLLDLLRAKVEAIGRLRHARGGGAVPADARSRCLARCLAWWQALSHAPHALSLLLSGAGEGEAADPLAGLLPTLQACEADLEELGAQVPAQALQEMVIWSIGRLTLARRPLDNGALDAECGAWLSRWLDGLGAGSAHEARAAAEQGMLF